MVNFKTTCVIILRNLVQRHFRKCYKKERNSKSAVKTRKTRHLFNSGVFLTNYPAGPRYHLLHGPTAFQHIKNFSLYKLTDKQAFISETE